MFEIWVGTSLYFSWKEDILRQIDISCCETSSCWASSWLKNNNNNNKKGTKSLSRNLTLMVIYHTTTDRQTGRPTQTDRETEKTFRWRKENSTISGRPRRRGTGTPLDKTLLCNTGPTRGENKRPLFKECSYFVLPFFKKMFSFS